MVMGLFNSTKCPQCGKTVNRQGSFCPYCGKGLAGGKIKCGVCATENPADAVFCQSCNRKLIVSGAPVVQGNHWSRQENDFAVRIEADDLPGLLRRGLVVEPGTNAMLVVKGTSAGIAPPGAYQVDNFLQGLVERVISGIPEQVTALLVDITPQELEFHLGGCTTQDHMPIGISIRMQAEVKDPARFLVNVLKGRERYSRDDLRQYLYPEVTQMADNWLRRHTLQELVEDTQARARIELALDEALRTTFGQTGLRFIQIRTLQLNLETYDRIHGLPQKYALQVEEKEARLKGEQQLADLELQAKRRWGEIQKEVNLSALAEETQKVEVEEKKSELYQRMRQAVMGDRMNEVKSETQFETFLDDLDRQKLLQARERADLLKIWKEEAEDKDSARAHLLAKLELESNFELRKIELLKQVDVDITKQDNEIELARKKTDFEFEMRRRTIDEEMRVERERRAIAEERIKADLALKALQEKQELDNDVDAARAGIAILAQMKEGKRLDERERLAMEREHTLTLAREKQNLELQRFEAEERSRQAASDAELKRIEAMGTLGAEALISMSGPEQARILADLKKSESLKGMSDDQILALAAKDSPQVAQALVEKFRAAAEGKAGAGEKDLYERMLSEKNGSLQQFQALSDQRVRDAAEANSRAQQAMEHALDRMADTSQTFARNQTGQPLVVVPQSAGPQVISTTPGGYNQQQQRSETKLCTGAGCGRQVDVDVRFCPYCGNQFKGV
jgi:endogenous inhibitor of DNA gyrase (YacG/DUF329 family)